MELQVFVKSTIEAVVKGVIDAQKSLEDSGAYVNPGGLTRRTSQVTGVELYDNNNANFARLLAFDIALTVEETQSKTGKVGVLSVISANVEAGSQSKALSVSRVQFSVPLLFPTMKGPDQNVPPTPTTEELRFG